MWEIFSPRLMHMIILRFGQILLGGFCLILLASCGKVGPLPAREPVAIGKADLTSTTIGVYLYPGDDIFSPAVDKMMTAGARWARSWFSWDDIEPELTDPPTYHWEETDERLLAARSGGLDVIFLLGGNATWASDTFCGPIHPPNQADFQRFLRDLVQRYRQPPYSVRLWEIYNEPDSLFGAQGYCFGGRGAAYAESLRLAYEAIKAADPEAIVLFGGISYDFFVDEGGRFDPAFLDDALAAGAGPYFDIFAFHYYPAFAERWHAFGPGVAGKAAYLRSELARYGLDKPLALTEIGRPTRGPDTDSLPYSEDETARFVAPALTRARIAGLAPIIWFTAVDKPEEPYSYGLLRANLHPEPGYFAFKAVLPALQGGKYLGEVEVPVPARAYRFQHKKQEAIIAWSEGETVDITLPVSELWLVDRNNLAQRLRDGLEQDADGIIDQRITLQLTSDPIVIWIRPALEQSYE